MKGEDHNGRSKQSLSKVRVIMAIGSRIQRMRSSGGFTLCFMSFGNPADNKSVININAGKNI